MTIAEQKAELRQHAKTVRDAAHRRYNPDAAAQKLAGNMLENQSLRKTLANTHIHASYRPIRSEMRTTGFEAIWREGLALPSVVGPDRPLIFRRWAPGDPLTKGAFGIEEPLPSSEIVTPDIILVPLLAFDAAGFRLGYGGGFYDRTLARLRTIAHDFCAIGLAYDEQEVEKVPVEETDIPLDMIVTPTRVITPR